MPSTASGHLLLVLHMHIPWVLGHGRWPHGEDWLYEAVAESYVPTLQVFDRLILDGISPKVTIGLTPVLAEMLASRTFAKGFLEYVEGRVALARKDEEEFRDAGANTAARLAAGWAAFVEDVRRQFESWDADLLGQFRRLQKDGHIEVITSAATHGYLPLLGTVASVAAQVRAGVATYRRHFRREPRGIWLPECAYRPAGPWSRPTGGAPSFREGLEEVLARNGLRFFFVDTHLVAGGVPMGTYEDRVEGKPANTERPAGVESPNRAHILIGKSGSRVAVFARDPKSSAQVWSADHGYPGDGAYLEFHRRKGTGGHRYSRVTNRQLPLEAKEEYQPHAAHERANAHADHFAGSVRETLAARSEEMDQAGVVVAPFDAELFGHWWFEGPIWLESVLRRFSEGEVTTITASEFLDKYPPNSVIALPEGSWGLGGLHHVWWNDDTKWVWQLVYRAEDAFLNLDLTSDRKRHGGRHRVLTQLARELLLLESSDWPFLITTASARDYASARVRLHAEAFDKLLAVVGRLDGRSLSKADEDLLRGFELRDAPFSELDLSSWSED